LTEEKDLRASAAWYLLRRRILFLLLYIKLPLVYLSEREEGGRRRREGRAKDLSSHVSMYIILYLGLSEKRKGGRKERKEKEEKNKKKKKKKERMKKYIC